MTRGEALAGLRRLAVGLGPNLAGVSRLRERVASQGDDSEALEDALCELGAMSLLEQEDVPAVEGTVESGG